MLQIVLHNIIRTDIKDIFLVLGANAEKIKKDIAEFPVQIIHNRDHEKGLGSSVSVGINQLLNYEGVLIVLADQPNVDSTYLKRLLSEFENQPDHAIASQYNSHYGVPAIFPKRYFSELMMLEGDKGAKEFLNSGTIDIKSINSSVNLFDVDTPEDYEKLIRGRNN